MELLKAYVWDEIMIGNGGVDGIVSSIAGNVLKEYDGDQYDEIMKLSIEEGVSNALNRYFEILTRGNIYFDVMIAKSRSNHISIAYYIKETKSHRIIEVEELFAYGNYNRSNL